jgi:phosphohistidine phosphatase
MTDDPAGQAAGAIRPHRIVSVRRRISRDRCGEGRTHDRGGRARARPVESAVKLFLVHHAEAVMQEDDSRRPLSARGEAQAERAAAAAAARGARPVIVWHSGKLRARQTAQAFWRACNPLAEFAATPDLQPTDPAARMRDRLLGESRDILIAGHFPHLPRLLSLLVHASQSFPEHGVVALESEDYGETWRESWRIASE